MKKPKPTKPLAERLTKTLLKQLRERKITNAQAAEQLGVSETYLSRTVAAMQVKEPGKTVLERKANAELAKTRRQFREKLAKEVLKNKKSYEDAAAEADCSLRTMFRYVSAYRAAPEVKSIKVKGKAAGTKRLSNGAAARAPAKAARKRSEARAAA